MPYNSIEAAKAAGFTTVINGTNLTLPQIQHLAEMYDAIKAKGDVDTPMAVAITTFKKQYRIEGDKWVKVETQTEFDDTAWYEFREVSIKSLSTRQAAASYHNRLHAMYVDNRQTKKQFSKAWVADKHRELVEWMKEQGWTHTTRAGALDKTLAAKLQDAIPFDESGLKEGKPHLVLRLGVEYDSLTGKKRVTVTEEMARHMVKNFNDGVRPGIEYGMPIDYDHALANMGKGEPVKKPTAADRVAGYVKNIFFQAGKGVMAIPAWTQDAVDTIKRIGTIGISSYFGTQYYNKRKKEEAGPTFFNFTLTPRPQQTDLAVTAQALTDTGNDKNDIYITHINFDEEEEMQFSDEITKALGDAPEDKIKALIETGTKFGDLEAEMQLFKEALGVKEGGDVQKAIDDLKDRPVKSEYTALEERTKKLEAETRVKEMTDRKKVLLFGDDGKGGYMTPAQMKTKLGAKIQDPDHTTREEFDEHVKNAIKLGSELQGEYRTPEEISALTEDEKAEATKLSMSEDEYKAYKARDYTLSVIDDLEKKKE